MNKTKIFRNTHDKVFYYSLVILPLIQFCIFYIYVNFNSIMLAFKTYDAENMTFYLTGFNNFVEIFQPGKMHDLFTMTINSFAIFIGTVVLGIPLSLLFAYYVYKRRFAGEFFNTMLYLPQIISGLVLALIYKGFVGSAIPEIYKRITGNLLLNFFTKNIFAVAFFFSIVFGFGTRVLMFLGAMKKIPVSTEEAAALDGATSWQDFIYIAVPQIFPTISTFVLTTVAGIFLNQMSLHSLDGGAVKLNAYTMGYYIYVNSQKQDYSMYPMLASLGLIFTAVTSVIIILVNTIMNKVDPFKD